MKKEKKPNSRTPQPFQRQPRSEKPFYQKFVREPDDKKETAPTEERRPSRRTYAHNDEAPYPPRRQPTQHAHQETAWQRKEREQKEIRREEIRLNRYIAQAGVCSRREADQMITDGLVRVNGKVVTELGCKVKFGRDVVLVNGKKVEPQNYVYILLNKPKNHLCTLSDPQGRRTVMDLLQGATQERIYPVGRLDRNTTGVLLFTNDGELAKLLTHPSHKVPKLYYARLDRPLEQADMERIINGLELEDGPIAVDKIDYVADGDGSQVGIEIHSGRNRIVRRIFEHLRYEVRALDRITIGPLTKKGVPRGRWRRLTEKEVAFLKMMVK